MPTAAPAFWRNIQVEARLSTLATAELVWPTKALSDPKLAAIRVRSEVMALSALTAVTSTLSIRARAPASSLRKSIAVA